MVNFSFRRRELKQFVDSFLSRFGILLFLYIYVLKQFFIKNSLSPSLYPVRCSFTLSFVPSHIYSEILTFVPLRTSWARRMRHQRTGELCRLLWRWNSTIFVCLLCCCFLLDLFPGLYFIGTLIRKMNDKLLKTAFSEFYLSLIMTQNYVKHNLLGFQKIMKKFDKNLNCKVNCNISFKLLRFSLQFIWRSSGRGQMARWNPLCIWTEKVTRDWQDVVSSKQK